MISPTIETVLQSTQVPHHQQPLSWQLQATAKQPCIPLPVHQQTQSCRQESAAPIVHRLSAQQQPVAPQGTLQTKTVDKSTGYSMMVPTTNRVVDILCTIIPLRC